MSSLESSELENERWRLLELQLDQVSNCVDQLVQERERLYETIVALAAENAQLYCQLGQIRTLDDLVVSSPVLDKHSKHSKDSV